MEWLDFLITKLILNYSWALLVVLFAIPAIIRMAFDRNILDRPNHRTVHEKLTPRLGGLAIFAGFMSAVTIFGVVNEGVQHVLAGALVIFFIGAKDDLMNISPFKKFFGQVLAAGIVIFLGDVRVYSFHGFLGIEELPLLVSYVFTLLLIIGITNATNLIDGLDGLAGSIVLVIAVTFGIYFIDTSYPYSFMAFALAGSVTGFLRFNIFKAKIFMGDTGSLLCGFMVAVLAIRFIEIQAVPASPAIALAVVIIPITDTLRVFTIRLAKGQSPFMPDKNHIHHRLLAMGLNQLTVVFTLVGFNLLVILVVTSMAHLGTTWLVVLIIITILLINTFIEISKRYISEPES